MKPPSPLISNLKDTCLVEHERQYAKDQRAYEHDRHQRKKAEMLLQRKTRKANGWPRTVHDTRVPPTMSSISKKEVLWREDTDTLDDLRVPEIESWRKLELRALSGEDTAFKREVKLADLIGAQKPRKSKGISLRQHLLRVSLLMSFCYYRRQL
jgi:hypothetical protein